MVSGSGSICAGTEVVEPVSVVGDLGVRIDAELSMRDLVTTYRVPLVHASSTYVVSDQSEHFSAVTSLSSLYAL